MALLRLAGAGVPVAAGAPVPPYGDVAEPPHAATAMAATRLNEDKQQTMHDVPPMQVSIPADTTAARSRFPGAGPLGRREALPIHSRRRDGHRTTQRGWMAP